MTLFIKIKRPFTVEFSYQDERGDKHNEKYTGLTSRIFQHEYDHMEGKNFTQLVSPLKRDIAKRKAKLEIAYKNEAVKWYEENGGLSQKSKDGTSSTEFTNNFQQNNPLFSDEDREVIKNLSDTIDPQFAGNDVIELNGKNYIKVGQDYYEL